jgi:hypothetical protein
MLEIGVFCVILLAAGYWTTMFVMGRRDDVIHGRFVHAEGDDAALPALPAPPPFPKRPVTMVRPVSDALKPVDSEALQSLLAAIQQDLRNVA